MIRTIKTIWNALEIRKSIKDLNRESAEEMKEGWPVLLFLAVVAFLPLTIALICGRC